MMTVEGRVEHYHAETGYKEHLFVGGDGRIYGTMIMGADYRVASGLYGGYPAGYLKRIKALFPDMREKNETLHLFSGYVDQSIVPGLTVDINPDRKPDYLDDAQSLEKVPVEKIKFVLADPPYSIEDCEHYGTTMIKRNRVMKILGRRLPEGAFVVWLDQVLPMYRKKDFELVGAVGMLKSTNHRFRIVTIFQKKGGRHGQDNNRR